MCSSNIDVEYQRLSITLISLLELASTKNACQIHKFCETTASKITFRCPWSLHIYWLCHVFRQLAHYQLREPMLPCILGKSCMFTFTWATYNFWMSLNVSLCKISCIENPNDTFKKHIDAFLCGSHIHLQKPHSMN